MSVVPVDAGVVYDPMTDWTASFVTPAGHTITATAKGPAGISAAESRKVTNALTLRYERKLYLLADAPANRRLIGK